MKMIAPAPPNNAHRSTAGFEMWASLLAEADSVQIVVTLANEYLSRLEPSLVHALPHSCKPRALSGAIDINAYAIDLKLCRCDDLRDAQAVQHVSAFFQAAAARISQILGPFRGAVPPKTSW
jgi:hypothetical protein